MPDASHSIFFSYARGDAPFVLKIANALREEGRRLWVDQLDIPKGARWDEEVENALKACSCLLVVLSPLSSKSQNVLDEVSYALEEKRTVLPLLLQAGSIPFRLKRVQYIDFTGDFDTAYRQLVAALDALHSPQAPANAKEAAPPPMVEPRAAEAEIRRVEAPPQRPPGREPASEVRTVAAPRRFPMGIVAAVAILLVLGASYLLFAPTKAPPAAPVPGTVRAPVGRPEAPPEKPMQRPEMATPSPVEVPRTPAAPVAAPALSDARVKAFVDEYIAAQNRGEAEEMLRFYAERVDYFDQKDVGRDFILRDKRSYYRRWPEVENRLASAVNVDRSHGENSALVTYTIRWRTSSPARKATASGAARDELMLRLVNDKLSIVAQRQQVLAAAN